MSTGRSPESELPLSRFMASEGKAATPLPYGSVQFGKEEQEEIQKSLGSQLVREEISSRKGFGGRNLSYITGGRVIQKANEIFGFNGWSTSIVDMSVDYCDKIDGSYSTGVTCVIRVTLKDGAQREDIGFGHAENMPYKYSALDKAKKEAVTDATKRALRLFGNQLGLCLYDKDFVEGVEKAPRPNIPQSGAGTGLPRSFGGVSLPQPTSHRPPSTNGTNLTMGNTSYRPPATSNFPPTNHSNSGGYLVRPTSNQPTSSIIRPTPHQTNPPVNPVRPVAPPVLNNSKPQQDNTTTEPVEREDSFFDINDFDLSQSFSQTESADTPTPTTATPTPASNTFSGISMSISPAFTSAAALRGVASPLNFSSTSSSRTHPTTDSSIPHRGAPDPKRHRG